MLNFKRTLLRNLSSQIVTKLTLHIKLFNLPHQKVMIEVFI